MQSVEERKNYNINQSFAKVENKATNETKSILDTVLESGLNDLKTFSEIELLSKDFFLKNIKTIGTILLLILISTSNRYTCQKQLAEIEKLKKELKDTRFEALTRSSELIGISRPSQVKALIKRQGIEITEADKPAYNLNE